MCVKIRSGLLMSFNRLYYGRNSSGKRAGKQNPVAKIITELSLTHQVDIIMRALYCRVRVCVCIS